MLFLKDGPEISKAQPVCLSYHSNQNEGNGSSSDQRGEVTVAGWGVVTNNVRVKIKNFREFGAGSKTLASFDVPLLEAEYCQRFYPSFDMEQHICTGGRGT